MMLLSLQIIHFTQELESVNEDVQAMSECCEEMTNRLKVNLIISHFNLRY